MAGTRKWEDAGKMIISLALTDIYPFGAGHTDTDVIVFYTEGLNDDYVKAVALDSDGDFIWTGDVVTMCSISSSKVHPEACALTGSQWIVAWEDERSGRDIYAQNINTDGTLGYIPVAVEPQYSEDAFLLTAIPNPFSTTTTISFNLTTESTENTEIKIYNVKGQLVKTLLPTTTHQSALTNVYWNGTDENGNQLSNGIYFYKLKSGEKTAFKKMILLR